MPTAQPTIVFLHGFAESREVWTEFTRPFPATYRLLAPNLLGHGTNLTPVPDFSMEAQARYVIDHLGRRNATEPVLLVGHSMGGYVALALAQLGSRHPTLRARIGTTDLPKQYGSFRVAVEDSAN